jgi:hypothetical protein
MDVTQAFVMLTILALFIAALAWWTWAWRKSRWPFRSATFKSSRTGCDDRERKPCPYCGKPL